MPAQLCPWLSLARVSRNLADTQDKGAYLNIFDIETIKKGSFVCDYMLSLMGVG